MASDLPMELPEDEREPVIEKLVPATKENVEYSLRALVGQIISKKTLNKKAVINIMLKTWEQYKGLLITDMGANKFLFTFPSVCNAKRFYQKDHGSLSTSSSVCSDGGKTSRLLTSTLIWSRGGSKCMGWLSMK